MGKNSLSKERIITFYDELTLITTSQVPSKLDFSLCASLENNIHTDNSVYYFADLSQFTHFLMLQTAFPILSG